MKILLLYPPAWDQSKYGKYLVTDAFPAVGLSYLYSYLKKHDYNCKIYDFFFDNWSNVKKILINENADIIGINCLTESRFSAFKLLFLVRKIKKDTIVIFGGHHATHMCDQLLNNLDIDFIVLGEGEVKLLKLIKAIEGKIPLESINGIAFKKNGEIIKNLSYTPEDNIELDSLPFPFSKDQIQIFEKYPPLNKIYPLEFRNFDHFKFVHEACKSTTIITSRGCPYNCQFCAARSFWGKKYRFRSPENVVNEIEYYYKKLGFRYFRIWDYAFTIIPERCMAICKEIVNRNLKIFFSCQTRADKITKDLVFWLKKAGCIYVSIGVESGSIKIIKDINKNLSLKSVVKAFTVFKKYNLPAYPFIMVGNPGETMGTINKTKNLMKIIRPYRIGTTKTMVLPGTELYNVAKEQGFINDNYWLTSLPQPYYTFENSLKTLKKWELQIIYYDKKKYSFNILRVIKNLETFLKRYIKKLKEIPNSKSYTGHLYRILSKEIVKLLKIRDIIQ